MKLLTKRHRLFALLTFAALLCSLLPGGAGRAVVVHAETSADPNEEIVYIDNTGVIRVLDTKQTSPNPEVKWVSPVGGYRDFALGDFNTDGDLEIVALSGGSTDGKLVVYDPVAASGIVSDPNQKINGIPWDTLYVTDTLGSPQLVDVGNFDINVPGDEIIYTYEPRPADKEKPSDNQRLVVLRATSQTPTGRGWGRHLTKNFEEKWEILVVGNLDNETTDEFVLSSEDNRILNAFRVDGGVQRIYDYGSDSKPPKAMAVGQWEADGRDELAFVRDKSTPLPSLYVLRYNKNGAIFEDVYTEPFEPSPRLAFFANINNNKDEELVLLRTVDEKLPQARMIVRGRNKSDIPAELEQGLDKDNGYRAGTGGDIDGDGKDEIILIRDNKILVFFEAERSKNTNTYTVSTDRRNVATGDLDKIGFVTGPQFAVSRTEVQAAVEAGGPAKQETVALTNATAASTGEVPFSVSVDGNPPWLSVSANTSTTPATLIFNFSANGVNAGDYTTSVRIDSSAAVVNKPLLIKASIKVTAALFAIAPTGIAISYDCATSGPIRTQSIGINGTPGLRYSAAILNPATFQAAAAGLTGEVYNGYLATDGSLVLRDGSDQESAIAMTNLVAASALDAPSEVGWLQATPVTGTIPSNITLTASPLISSTTKYAEALLVVVADTRAGSPPGNVRVANVSILCASATNYLPAIQR